MPRSGHHFLHRILMNYFGEQFGYCSFYSHWKEDYFPSCCGNIPCSKYKDTQLSIFFQKSHDFHLTDPVDVADLSIVQVREPIARLFSNYKLHLKTNPKRDTFVQFRQFALKEYYYYIAFWQKWMLKPSDKRMVVSYESLTSQPVNVISELVRATGHDVDEVHLQKVLTEQKKQRGGGSKYVPKDVREHKYYDREWALKYADRIRHACPDFDRYCDMHEA